jgi:hypothetical protein
MVVGSRPIYLRENPQIPQISYLRVAVRVI